MCAVNIGYADVNGATLYYEIEGTGQPLVLVHAGVADCRLWDDQVPILARQYQVIRYDLRGHGKSEPLPGDYAHHEDLSGLLAFLKVQHVHLIGCSVGGTIAMDFTFEHPDMVESLVMICSQPSGLNIDTSTVPKAAEMQAAATNGNWPAYLELAAQLWLDGEGRRPDQVPVQARERMISMYRKFLENTRKPQGQVKAPLKPSATERISQLDLPVLIIYGGYDTAFSKISAQYMGEHIAGAQKVLMSDTAHLPSLDCPEEVTQHILDFLSSVHQKPFTPPLIET